MGNKARGTKGKQSRGKKDTSRKPAHTAQKGRLLEEIAARMHGGDARVKVQRNIKLPGRHRNPKYPGEIDVLLTSAMLGYPVTHAIECKNLKGKVGKGNIESFIGKLEDVNIPHQHGIYISAKGYTKDAIDRASTTGIKLLTMTGLTPDGLASITAEAAQHCVFYLAQVRGVSVTNNVDQVIKAEELMMFYDRSGKLRGTVIDLLWNKWQEGAPRSEAGEYEVSIRPPRGWHQLVNGRKEPVISVDATIQVWALVFTVSGRSEHHALVNAADMAVERTQIDVSFDVPEKGRVVHELKGFMSEAELEAFLEQSPGVRLTTRTRLPRIQYLNLFFYPFSQRVAERIKAHTSDFVAGKASTPPPPLSLTELEGTDLSAMWEPLAEGYPGKAVPVVVTTDEGEVVDVHALMRAGEFGRVTELSPYYERSLRPALGELICEAFMLHGLKIADRAKKTRNIEEARRLGEIAVEKAHTALRMNPGMPEGEYELGVILLMLGQYEQALACFDNAVAKTPEQPHMWLRRAEAQARLRRYEESLESYDRALQLAPEDADAVYERSGVLMSLGRFEACIAGFEQVTADRPDDYRPWYYLGAALNKLSRFDEALGRFDGALERERDDADVWGQRGLTLHNLGRIDEAAENYKTALRLDTGLHQVALVYGLALAHLGRFPEALINLDKGLAHQPGDFEVWRVRSAVLERLERDEEALESITRALEFEPDERQGLLRRGVLLQRLERYAEAVACFSRAIELDPTDASAWHSRGLTYYFDSRDEEALADYDQVLTISPGEPGTLSNRASCLAELGRLEEALASVDEALRLSGDAEHLFVPLLVRAKVYQRLGRLRDAADDFVAAWAIEPDKLGASEEYRDLYAELYPSLSSPSAAHSALFSEMCGERNAA